MSTRPPFWVISLVGSPRREFVTSAFAGIGAPFEFVDAVDGAHLSRDEQARYSRRRALFHVGRGLTTGELGVALSHLHLYRRMVEERVPEAVIFEDDATPSADFLALVDAAPYPSDWDVVNFMPLFGRGRATPVGPPLLDRYRVCTYDANPFGAGCYLIRGSAAGRLLQVGEPVGMPADDLIFRRRPAGLRSYGIEPRAVTLGELPSERIPRDGRVGSSPAAARAWERPLVLAGKLVHKTRAGR
jgi:glycosyl transferase family 25